MINRIERILLIISLIIISVPILLLLSLVINGLHEVGVSITEYYEYRDYQREACLNLAKSSKYETYWKDETFFGFGSDDSYGCFQSDNLKEKE